MGLFSEAWASSGHQFLIKSNPIQLGDFGKVKIDVDFNDRAYAIGIDKANRHSYYISFMVQNLTHSNQGAEVWLNNKKIGEIHELSLVKSIVDTCQKIVQEKDAHWVKSIELQVGTLSGVDIDALNFAWDAGVKDTVLEKATYNLKIKKAIAVCDQCQTHYQTDFLYDPWQNAKFSNIYWVSLKVIDKFRNEVK